MSSGKIEGRPKKPYRTSWGEESPGLTRCGDGRWRINAAEQRFTDDDEGRAVTRAEGIIQAQTTPEKVRVETTFEPTTAELAAADNNAVDAVRLKLSTYGRTGEHMHNSEELIGKLPCQTSW